MVAGVVEVRKMDAGTNGNGEDERYETMTTLGQNGFVFHRNGQIPAHGLVQWQQRHHRVGEGLTGTVHDTYPLAWISQGERASSHPDQAAG